MPAETCPAPPGPSWKPARRRRCTWPLQRPRRGAASAGEAAGGCALRRLLSTGDSEGFAVAMVTEAVALTRFCAGFLGSARNHGLWEVGGVLRGSAGCVSADSAVWGLLGPQQEPLRGSGLAPPAWCPGASATFHLARRDSPPPAPPRQRGGFLAFLSLPI